jgi:hypothetical protein
MDQDVAPKRVVDALSTGMETVGTRFEAKEYFLSELMMAGDIFKMAQEVRNLTRAQVDRLLTALPSQGLYRAPHVEEAGEAYVL